ncbi:MAG: AAA family ATPase [Neobacillus sp.]
MAKIVFVCGPHCSGKTSILKELQSRGDIVLRGSEIGKDLYYERKFLTEAQDHFFEMEVATREFERDLHYEKVDGLVGVETWHPGNIAYAAVRNPDSVPELLEFAGRSPFITDSVGIWLRIPKETIIERTQTFKDSREWAGDFYHKIDSKLEVILDNLNLLSKTIIIDANKPQDEVLDEVQRFIQAHQAEMIK